MLAELSVMGTEVTEGNSDDVKIAAVSMEPVLLKWEKLQEATQRGGTD